MKTIAPQASNVGKIETIFSSAFVLLLLFGIISPAKAQTSDKLEVPKIYLGDNFLEKKEIFRFEKTAEEKAIPLLTIAPKDGKKRREVDKDSYELNDIEQIYAGEIDNIKGTDILAAGEGKAFILDTNGKVKRSFDYKLGNYGKHLDQKNYIPFIKIVDVNNDGKVEIVGHGSINGVIIDLQGKVLWQYKMNKKDADTDYIVIGDINNDGKNEVVIAIENKIEIFDLKGKLLNTFELADEIFESALRDPVIADFDGDGKNEILVNEIIYSAKGEKIREVESPYSWDSIFVGDNGKISLLEFEDSKLKVSDVNGKSFANFDAPLSSLNRKKQYDFGYSIFNAQAIQVKLLAEDTKFLAVLANADDPEEYGSFYILYVYDPSGRLVFQENIRASDSRICTIKNENGTESLLVTDDGKINLYKLK